MAYELKDGQGSLSRNKDKDPDENPNWADYKGKIKIDGRLYYLSGWIKDGNDGKWVSLAAKPADESRGNGSRTRQDSRRDNEGDRDPW